MQAIGDIQVNARETLTRVHQVEATVSEVTTYAEGRLPSPLPQDEILPPYTLGEVFDLYWDAGNPATLEDDRGELITYSLVDTRRLVKRFPIRRTSADVGAILITDTGDCYSYSITDPAVVMDPRANTGWRVGSLGSNGTKDLPDTELPLSFCYLIPTQNDGFGGTLRTLSPFERARADARSADSLDRFSSEESRDLWRMSVSSDGELLRVATNVEHLDNANRVWEEYRYHIPSGLEVYSRIDPPASQPWSGSLIDVELAFVTTEDGPSVYLPVHSFTESGRISTRAKENGTDQARPKGAEQVITRRSFQYKRVGSSLFSPDYFTLDSHAQRNGFGLALVDGKGYESLEVEWGQEIQESRLTLYMTDLQKNVLADKLDASWIRGKSEGLFEPWRHAMLPLPILPK